ncbi:MAG: colanic acid biosynthesis glycosyltransferase WcaL [Moorea sp. SIO2B7]|nr:colanic acid biosynthesis glycosyltransferase WcaL [Moorena sp. SIO2B7]
MITTVAYLAPEIPSLSATFVYNEILALQEKGLKVISISVHYPIALAQEVEVKELFKNTIFLYSQNFISLLGENLLLFARYPNCYLKALLVALNDALKVGLIGLAGPKLLYQFLQASKVARIIKQNSCQHLHIHFSHTPTQIGMYASLLSKIPFTFTSHANDLFQRGLILKEKVDRAKAAITISEYNRDFLIKQKANSKKIEIIRCGVDSSQYEFLEKEKLNHPPVIGSLARLVEKKGMDSLVMALSNLQQKNFDFSLEIAGDGPLIEFIKELVSENDLDSKVKFKGAIAHDKVFSWLSNLDIFVLASKKDSNGDQDGIPVVLMEAMAVGIPVISTDISGIPELIQDGVSGFLALPNDPESLSQAIEKLFNLTQPVSQITKVAKRRINEEFDKNINIDRLLKVFNEKH